MSWNDYVEGAKVELGYSSGEWIDNFDEVIELAKNNYWKGEDFKDLKEETIEDGGNECSICCGSDRLTLYSWELGIYLSCVSCNNELIEKVNEVGNDRGS